MLRSARAARRAAWLVSASLVAAIACAPRADAQDQAHDAVEIVLFERSGCPHCEHASEWLEELARRRPEVRLERRDVASSPGALHELRALAEAEGVRPVAVPAIAVRGRLFVGWDSAATTGRAIEAWLDRGAETGGGGAACAPEGAGGPAPCDAAAGDAAAGDAPAGDAPAGDAPAGDAGIVRLPIVGEISARDLGLPLFTIAIGLVDGFNPCAMWVLLFLLSMLVNLQDRARMALVAGTFVLVSALVYFAFMAAWLEAYLLIGLSRPLQIALGVFALGVAAIHVKDFFAPGRGVSLSIPDSAKPGIYARVRAIVRAEDLPGAMVMVTGLAVVVSFVELLCTAGLPALYTQVLASHELGRGARYAYLALYDLAYMLDDGIMVAIGVITLGRRKLQERGGRVLKLVSGVVIGALGIVLIVAPELLAWG